MKTKLIALIIIGVVIFGSFSFVYALMYDCLNPPAWIKFPKSDIRYCLGLLTNGFLPDYPTWEEYLASKETRPEPEGGNPKLTELMESGGFIVETRTLRFPERTYTTLANHEDTKNEWFIVNGVLAFGSETHEVIIPTKLDLYTDDGKVTSVMSYVSLEETIEYAETLELNSGYIDLNDYIDPNWTDGPTETLDEIPQVEPEPDFDPHPEPEPIISEAIDLVVDANNQFALDFYSQVTADKEENVFFSPWSISIAFAIAYEGAKGDTAQEISSVFEFPQEDNLRRSLFQYIQNDLNEKDANYSLNTANALWIKEGYEIKQDYINTAKVYYDSKVDNVDFVTDEGVNIINEWVKTKTNNKIEDLLAEGSTDELTRLVITNAIYFKGEWAYPFSPEWTRESDFHINKDKTVKVSMMDLDDRKLNYTQNQLLEILELPYKGDKVFMLILLPKEIEGLKSVEEDLTVEKLSQWRENLSETQIAVLLPKFTAETKYDLKDNLQNMGMKIPFDKLNADFSGINETEQLYIDQAVHKAFVNVYELGTEAAAATGIEMRLTSGPPATFRADHPFIFIIQDNQTGNILFIGKMVDPTQ